MLSINQRTTTEASTTKARSGTDGLLPAGRVPCLDQLLDGIRELCWIDATGAQTIVNGRNVGAEPTNLLRRERPGQGFLRARRPWSIHSAPCLLTLRIRCSTPATRDRP